MKRFLLFSLMQLFAFSMFAQTLESPLELPIGEVTVEGESTYFKYTAPEDKNVFLQVTTSGWSTSVTVSTDGTEETMFDGAPYNGHTLYPVNKGEEVIVWASTWGEGGTFNTAVIENTTIGSGLTCDDAVLGTQEPFYIPSIFDWDNYEALPSYISFTVPEGDESGLLEMTFYSYPSSITLFEGCDDEEGVTVEITEADDYKNIASVAVEPGKTYIIQTTSYAAMMGSFRFFVPEPGFSCAMPLDGVVGENTLPAAAGRYWYEVAMDKAGALVVGSEVDLTGGVTRIYANCNDYEPAATANYLQGRRVFAEAGSYFVYVEKATATDADEKFTISVEDLKPYDAIETAEALTNGDYTTPAHNGVYYYTIKTPEAEGSYFIDVTPGKEFSNYSTRLRIYPTTTMSVWDGGQEDVSIHLVAEANTDYILEWYCEEDMNNIPFNVNIYQIQKGQVITDPITAVKGSNDLAAGEWYYTYTATQTGWLLIDTDADIEVTFPRGTSQWDGNYTNIKSGTINKIEVEQDMQYYIKFAGVAEETSFELSEAEYQQGESATNPFIIDESGVGNIPAATGTSYYKYVSPKDGMMEVMVNALSEWNNATSMYTQVSLTIDGQRYNVSSNNDGTYSGTFPVNKDSEVIVMVVLPSAQEDKTVNLSVRDLLPGESSSMPIVIEHSGEGFDYLFPEVRSRLNQKWYSIQLYPGEFSISTTQNYFQMTLHKADDVETQLASAITDWNADPVVYSLTYEVAEAGEYLLCLAYDYGEFDAAISGSALKAPAPIASIDELSNSKAYTIVNKRTAWGVNDTNMKTINDLGLAADETDTKQQFALLTNNKGVTYHLYSVAQSKFVGKGGALSDTPTDPIKFKDGYVDSTFVLFIDDVNYFNAGGSKQTAIDDWSAADKGNSNYIKPVANFDATAALALIAEAEKDLIVGISSLDELSNGKAYYVQNTRGAWAYDPAYTVEEEVVGPNMLVSTGTNGVATDLADANKQFAFLKSAKGNYYLYSVAAQKFAVLSEKGVALAETPDTITNILTGTGSKMYPWVVALNQSQIGISHDYTEVGGLISFWNDLTDAGNMVQIVEAGDFDATAALAVIEAYENPVVEATTVEVNPAPGHYDALPDSIVLTFSANIDALEFGVLRTESAGMRGYNLTEEDYTIADNVLTLTLPEELLAYNAQAMLMLQVTDANGNLVTYGDNEEYITLEYTAPVISNIFACVAITPEDGSEVAELKEFTLTFANPKSSFDFVGGVDATKAIVLKDAEGNVVANGTASANTEEFGMDVVITLDKAISAAGTYTLVVPEATVFNASYDPSAEDLGIEWGALYNPEFTATFTIVVPEGIEAIIGNATNVKVYDIKGRLVGNSVKNLKKGIYVINGKKVMVK